MMDYSYDRRVAARASLRQANTVLEQAKAMVLDHLEAVKKAGSADHEYRITQDVFNKVIEAQSKLGQAIKIAAKIGLV